MPSDTWLDECSFEKIGPPEGTILIEGGWDDFERVDIREEKDGAAEHIFKVVKRTEIFDIEMIWAVEPKEDELEDDELLKERAQNSISSESSYQAAHYLKSMGLPPLQALFTESMTVELVPENSDVD